MAGASGTHSVCVCTIHQNVKYVGSLQNIRTRSSGHHLSFHDLSEYPEPTDLENTLEDVFTDNAIENITFKQWISTDGC
jgi:hypothetical protein